MIDEWDPPLNYLDWVVGNGRWFVVRGVLKARVQHMTNFSSRP